MKPSWKKGVMALMAMAGLAVLILAFPHSTSAQTARVEAERLVLSQGESGMAAVSVKSVIGSTGLGAYNFTLTFDPAVVKLDAINAGDAPFDVMPVANIDNVNGKARFLAVLATMKGATGDIVVARLAIGAIGRPGTSTDLKLSINPDGLLDARGNRIEAALSSGMVSIRAIPATTTLPSSSKTPGGTPSTIIPSKPTPTSTPGVSLSSAPRTPEIVTPVATLKAIQPVPAESTPVAPTLQPPSPSQPSRGFSCSPRLAVVNTESTLLSHLRFPQVSFIVIPFLVGASYWRKHKGSS